MLLTRIVFQSRSAVLLSPYCDNRSEYLLNSYCQIGEEKKGKCAMALFESLYKGS